MRAIMLPGSVQFANHEVDLTYRYMRSNTKALWPMLIEKAWIKLLGGAGYDDICPDGDVRQRFLA